MTRHPSTWNEQAEGISRAIPAETFAAFQRFLSMRETRTSDLASRRFQ